MLFLLPIIFGTATAALTAWDIHNWHVIERMGMAWDIGAPAWPYMFPDAVLKALNAPAFVLFLPFRAASPPLQMSVGRHWVLLPITVLWWMLVGRYLDWRSHKPLRRTSTILGLSAAAILMLLVAGVVVFNVISYERRCGLSAGGAGAAVALLPLIGTFVWCGLLVAAAIRGLTRQLRSPRAPQAPSTAIL